MRILGIILAIFFIIYGARLVITAGQAVITGRLLMRRGIRTYWQPAPSWKEAAETALREGIMGLLLVALGVFMIW